MKSIIEQASSIMKAIEKAWDQAEKPKEFSIKIFEQEEKNFFGMSTKPAKIGIFFGDKPTAHEKPTSKPRPEIKECRPSFTKSTVDKSEPRDTKQTPKTIPQSQPQKTAPSRPAPTSPQVKPAQPRVQTAPKKESADATVVVEEKLRRTPAAWNDTMIATTHNWLKQTLSLMNMPSIEFNSEVAGKNLKLTFNVPLITDVTHEKQLFRSFAHLIMSSLRNQYKQEIRDLKVVLIRPE
ncbi:MAG TPA: hypothetical protein VKR54_05115 [Candidatus Babeliales bacterium]|jgi:hypothetical protein|nr:hypothetical protein [Candidatus Babeliales bacterium]